MNCRLLVLSETRSALPPPSHSPRFYITAPLSVPPISSLLLSFLFDAFSQSLSTSSFHVTPHFCPLLLSFASVISHSCPPISVKVYLSLPLYLFFLAFFFCLSFTLFQSFVFPDPYLFTAVTRRSSEVVHSAYNTYHTKCLNSYRPRKAIYLVPACCIPQQQPRQ